MVQTTRRTYLGGCAAGIAAGLSGCSSIPSFGNGDGETSIDWLSWAPRSMVAGREGAEMLRMDIPTLRATFPPEAARGFQIPRLRETYGLEPGAISSVIGVSPDEQTNHVVIQGEFRADAVLNALGGEDGRYGDFSVAGTQVAVDDGVIVATEVYRALIDAHADEAENLAEEEPWTELLPRVPDGSIILATPEPTREWTAQAGSVRALDGDRFGWDVVAIFPAESAAADYRDTFRASVLDDDVEYDELDVSVDGRFVEVEAASGDYDI